MKSLQKTKIAFFLFFICFFSKGFSATINFKANSMKGSIGENNQNTTLIGNAWIETDTMELFADKITLQGDNYDFIIAEGNVKGSYKDSGFSFSCDILEFNQSSDIVILKNNVFLEDPENQLVAKAKIIEYDNKLEIATMQVNVEITHKDSVCYSTLAIYKKKDQLLDLSGNPKILQGKDTFSAQEITLNKNSEEILLDGKVSGYVIDKKENTTQEE